MKLINVLHISPDFNYACGVSKYVYLLLKYQNMVGGINSYFLTNGGDSLDRLYDLDVTQLKMTFKKGIQNLLFMFPNIVKLFFYCRKLNIHIIHTHHRYPELLAVIISLFTNVKTVTTVHSHVRRYRFFSFRSNRIIAVSKSAKDNLVQNYGLSDEKIYQIYNFVEEYEKRTDNGRVEESDEKEFTVLYAGRISKQKGTDILLDAVKEIADSSKNIQLIVAGEIDKELNSNMKENYYPFLTYYPPMNDISELYEQTDLVILPSRQDSFPYVMLEAGLHKKAVIGSNVDGIPEYIDNNYNGLLFNSGDHKELAKKIRYCMDNREQLKRIGEENYKKALSYGTSQEYVMKVNSIYEELISKK